MRSAPHARRWGIFGTDPKRARQGAVHVPTHLKRGLWRVAWANAGVLGLVGLTSEPAEHVVASHPIRPCAPHAHKCMASACAAARPRMSNTVALSVPNPKPACCACMSPSCIAWPHEFMRPLSTWVRQILIKFPCRALFHVRAHVMETKIILSIFVHKCFFWVMMAITKSQAHVF